MPRHIHMAATSPGAMYTNRCTWGGQLCTSVWKTQVQVTSHYAQSTITVTNSCGDILCFSAERVLDIPHSGKLSREKLLQNSWFCGYSWNFGVWCALAWQKQAIRKKFSPQKSYFSPICESFLPWKFSAMQYFNGNALGCGVYILYTVGLNQQECMMMSFLMQQKENIMFHS